VSHAIALIALVLFSFQQAKTFRPVKGAANRRSEEPRGLDRQPLTATSNFKNRQSRIF
jgi:hypothetical protein